MKLTARFVADALDGELVGGTESTLLEAVSIDSRHVEPGDLFFAIKGPHNDGHRYVSDALGRGAIGIVASEPIELDDSIVCIRVHDTSRGLQRLARSVRRLATLRVVAITGSMGKTTTKEAAASAIGACRSVLKTQGNLNNLYGLPLSLLKWRGEQVAVLEMGMSEPGEIARLTDIARPDVGVLTNVAAVHLEFFSSVSEIARAKGELMAGLSPDATAVINADDPLVLEQARRFAGKQIHYGVSELATLRAEDVELDGKGLRFVVCEGAERVEVLSPLFGMHNVHNLLAGIAAARALELPLHEATRGLDGLKVPSHRGERHRLSGGAVLFDDTYNSNPVAVRAALHALSSFSARRHIAVLGDMLELGDEAESLHRQLGAAVGELGIDRLIAVGEFAPAIISGAVSAGMPDERLVAIETSEQVVDALGAPLEAGDAVLFKASRGLALDRAVRELVDADATAGSIE